MTNFLPFKGEHILSFGQESTVTIIHGENMTGKTSIFNALRWAWYGRAFDRHRVEIRWDKLINQDAAKDRDYTASVHLEFDVEGVNYQLKRQIQARNISQMPETNNDFEEQLFLEEDRRNLATNLIQEKLNELMPESISEFFLFDGEQLNRYEELVMDNRTQPMAIQTSIEKILGIPSLKNTIEDLQSNLDEAARRQQRAAAADNSATAAVEQARRCDTLKENCKGEIHLLEDQITTLSGRRSELEERLRESVGIEQDIRSRELIREQISDLNDSISESEASFRNYISVSWKDLLFPIVSKAMGQKQIRKDEVHNRQLQKSALEHEIHLLRTNVNNANCDLCGQVLREDHIHSANDRLAAVITEFEMIPASQEEYELLNQEIKYLARLTPENVAHAIGEIEQNQRTYRRKKLQLDAQFVDLEDRLRNHNEPEIQQNRLLFEDLSKQLVLAEDKLTDQRQKLDELTAEGDRYRTQIGRDSGPELQRLNTEVELYESLRNLFTGCLHRLRDRLREDVESDATEVFLNLTTDESYARLKINDRYGLTILQNDDREVPLRSAGAEQIVALSLISALNQNAVRQGPVVMDTPFGRLDQRHRENVLKHISTMSDQVIILAHSGEVENSLLESIRSHVGKEFTIVHPSSTTSYVKVASGESDE